MAQHVLDRDVRCRYLAVRNLSCSGLSLVCRSEGEEQILGFVTKSSGLRVTFISAGVTLEDFPPVEEVANLDGQQAG